MTTNTKRGRPPKKGPKREVRVEFMVFEGEREKLDKWARQDGVGDRSVWIREQLGLKGDV